jgi:hypothetical protein
MGGIAFFFVGAVLFVTAMLIMGKTDAKNVGVLHGILGTLLFIMVIQTIVTAKGPGDYFFAFILLLFVFTYLPVATTYLFGFDGRAVGWYCLVVAVFIIPTGAHMWGAAYKTSILLWIYGGLWFCFFLLMGLGKAGMTKFVGYYTLVVSLLAMIPGYLMLVEKW